ncbi:PREDICTED: uncharacterized protein LOC106127838 [Papilio xuthus]|uniref:Uncharacterized protein LOC106127838 n=1 Tax=Papilio xuthus TaxID=66420 RepID=A0AAJ6ZYK7_PAPXU|nr:PREDICTED: uncharacterized protein LOC106127838 [Papilio xuthus]
MREQSNASMKRRTRFITCEICKCRAFKKAGTKREFMTRFPMDEARCREWVRLVGKEDLAYVPIEKLHSLKYLCGQHFTPRSFNRKKSRLRKNAIPSLNFKYPPLSDEILADFPLHMYQDSNTEAFNEDKEIPTQSGPTFLTKCNDDMRPRNIDTSLIVPYIASGNFPSPDSPIYEDFVDEPPTYEENEASLGYTSCADRNPIMQTEICAEKTAVVTLDPLTRIPKLLIKPKEDAIKRSEETIFDKKNIIDVTQLPMFRRTDLLSDCTFIRVNSKNMEQDEKDEEPKKEVLIKKRVKKSSQKQKGLNPRSELIVDEKGRILLKHFPISNPVVTSKVKHSESRTDFSNQENTEDKEEQQITEDIPQCIVPDMLEQEFNNNVVSTQTIETGNNIVPVTRGEKFLYEYILQVRKQLAECKYLITKQLLSIQAAQNIVSNPELLATIEHVPSTQKLLTLLPTFKRKQTATPIKQKIDAISILTKAPYGYSFLCKMLQLPRTAGLLTLIKQAEQIMSIVNSMYEQPETETVPL